MVEELEMIDADVVKLLAKDGDDEVDREVVAELDPDRAALPEADVNEELVGVMVEFEPVGNMVLARGTPDDV